MPGKGRLAMLGEPPMQDFVRIRQAFPQGPLLRKTTAKFTKSMFCCMQARGGKPGKGRLAMLKEDNAKLCAPKTRIPTPAPLKKTRAVTVPAPSFVSKIPSPKNSSGGLPSVCTPEPDSTAQASEEASDADNGALPKVIAKLVFPVLPVLQTRDIQHLCRGMSFP